MTICYVPPLFSSILLKVESEIWEAKSGFFGTILALWSHLGIRDLFLAPGLQRVWMGACLRLRDYFYSVFG